MRKWIGAFIVLSVVVLIFYGNESIASAAQTNLGQAKVAVNVLNVRSGPSLTKPVIAQVTDGDRFQILDERFGWLEIPLSGNRTGWIAGQFTIKNMTHPADSSQSSGKKKQKSKSKLSKTSTITLLYNGTNLRNGPGTTYKVISQASQGDRFTVINQTGNWYHITLPSGTEAYVAGWIVVPSKKEKAALSGKTIVVDPGHGGKDSGAIGINGIMEKNLTLQTASELATKLRDAGAHVIMTKNNDTFISLQGRVDIAEKHNADAFISIHYNASLLQNEGGITSYYYTKSKDRPLALAIQQMLVKQTDLRNRGVRFADYHVLRENSQPAALLELGFVTNPGEVHVIRTSAYQDTITTAIVNGIENYFQGNK